MIGFALAAIAVLGCIAATLSDIRTREISNELNLFLLLSGIGLRGYHAWSTGSWDYLTTALAVGAIYFALSAALFYTRQWGGGDAKLLIALGCLLGTYPEELFAISPFPGGREAGIPLVAGNPRCTPPCLLPPWPFWATIVLNLMFVGAVYGVFSTMYLGIRNPRSLTELKRTLRRDERELLVVIAGLAAFVLGINFVFTGAIDLPFLAGSWPLLGLGAFIWFLIKFAHIIEEIAMVREIPVTELREDDWLAEDVVVDERLFAWKDVPGDGEDDLREHLASMRGLGWASEATASRQKDSLALSRGRRRVTLTLEGDGTRLVVREGKKLRGELAVREEDGELIVYATGREVASVHDTGVSQEQIDEILRLSGEHRFKDTIRIKEGVPFAPVFPLAILLSLFAGDVTFLVILHYAP